MRRYQWSMTAAMFGLILATCSVYAAGGDGCQTRPDGRPWLGVHVMLTSRNHTAELTEVVGRLAELGVNAIVAEINYGYEYQSHPELRSGNVSNKEQIGRLVAECRKHNVRLIPQFQCLGHQ